MVADELELARKFIESSGSLEEGARLNYILYNEFPPRL